MPSPSASVPRLILEYDDDPVAAADALLAVLRPAIRSAEPAESEDPEEDDEAA